MKREDLAALVVLLVVAGPATLEAVPPVSLGDWAQTAGPEGGAIVAFATHGSTLFAGTWGGGLHRSDDGGLTWSRVEGGFPSSVNVNGIAVANGVVVVATTESGLYRSTDGGQTWAPANEGLAGLATHQMTAHGDDLFLLLGDAQLGDSYKSTDQGLNWTLLFPPTAFIQMVATESVILGNSALAIGNYRSFDDGETWEAAPDGGFIHGVMNRYAAIGSTIYGARPGLPSEVYSTMDAATSWTPVAIPTGAMHRLQALGATLFVMAQPDAPEEPLHHSDDGGATWDSISTGLPGGQGQQVNCVGQLGGTLFAGTEKGVSRSLDGGATWQEANTGLVATFVQDLISDGAVLYATVAHYPDHGVTTSRQDETPALDEVFRSDDGGASWVPHHTGLPDAANVKSLAYDDLFVYAGAVREGVYRSSDGGTTWEASSEGLPEPWGAYGEIDFLAVTGSSLFAATRPRAVGGGHGSVMTQGGGVYRSDDQGTSWVEVTNGIPLLGEHNPPFSFQHYPYPTGLSVVDGVLFFAGERMGIFRSDDGGALWVDVNTGLPVSQHGHYPRLTEVVGLGSRIYAGASGFGFADGQPAANGVFVSDDGGFSWTQTAAGLAPGRPVTSLVADCTDLYAAVGCQAYPDWCEPDPADGVYRSRDAGLTWTGLADMPEGISVSPLALQGVGMAAGTLGHGVWTVPVVSDCNDNATPDNCETLQDFNFDCQVDLADFAAFQQCFTGTDAESSLPSCGVFDFEADGDIDLDDYAEFHAALTGP
ncbi:MAG: WD40/YVTN/BNR-like repeat-containing protein [Planctomycetota bacterium]|jgi:photosystem II stability/assembly factor-like uncharacterized protein